VLLAAGLNSARAQGGSAPVNPKKQESEPVPSIEEIHESPNPAQAVADKTKDLALEAVKGTEAAGEISVKKLRDWESSWLTGPYAGKNGPLETLSGKERWQIYLRGTLTAPAPYWKRMLIAGIDQARGDPYAWGGGWAGYSRRFASREGQFVAANSLAALGNAALKYEPRYDQCQCSGFRRRAEHAILRNFMTYNETEQELRPQWALYGGAFGGGIISAAWKPEPRNAFAEGGRAMLGQVLYGTLLNFVTEFSRDINRKIGSRRDREIPVR